MLRQKIERLTQLKHVVWLNKFSEWLMNIKSCRNWFII